MCLIVFAWHCHPDYPLILAGNRDEFYRRAAQPAAAWPGGDILGGRDLQGGGTWLAVHRDGRFGAVTNYRSPSDLGSEGPTRGGLVSRYLEGGEPPLSYLQRLTRDERYRGFNLLLGDPSQLHFGSNRDGDAPRAVATGIHGVSNALLDSPWPKVERAKSALAEWLSTSQPDDDEGLLRLLADASRPPDHSLPATGIGLEWERALGSIFIHDPGRGYGTRCSTILRLRPDGTACLTERSFEQDGQPSQTLSLTFGGKV